MIDHITLKVNDLEKSKVFFRAVLEPLGYVMLEKQDWSGGCCFCSSNKRDVWLQQSDMKVTPGAFSCLAFGAQSQSAVDTFHKVGLAAGGRDNGAPGFRPQYGDNYYAAFVLDPDGNNIEAVYDARDGFVPA